MNRFKKISIVTVALLLAASFAFADEAGRFVSIEGRVDLLKAGAVNAVAANADDIVSAGDIVRTKSRSKAEIDFADNSSLKIGENSRVRIKEYNIENGERTSAVILLERGGIRATVSKTSNKDDFIIDTPNATGSVKGTDLFVTFQKSATSVLVVKGKFSVANIAFPDKVVNITSGNTAFIPANEPPQEPREYLALEKNNYETATEPAVQKAVALKKEAVSEAVAEGYTEPGETKAKIIAVSGRVLIKNRGSITWHDAKADELLGAGDIIETKENGRIEIGLDNGNVINLKPDSQLVLQKLTEDTKTGDYENLFESGRGKLRAKVEKIKGNSKFEVKTPTAVACVRGTTMFLNILPNLTNSYFEDGNGYVQSVISGVSKIVAAGLGSSIDGNGNVTDPLPPSESELSSWHEGWGIGGAEGYSSPTGDGTTGDTGETETITGGTPPFSDKPFTDLTLTGTGGAGGGTPPPETYFNAELILDTTLADWPEGGQDTELTGTYSDPYSQKLLWNTITGSDADNGSFTGWVAGSWHSWEGVFSSIYIDDTGKAGYFGNFLNYLSGTYTGETAGTVTANGELIVMPLADLEPGVPYNIEVGAGGGELNVSLLDGGALNTTFDRAMKRIEGQSWGIWKEIYEGTYTAPAGLTLEEDGRAYWAGITGGRYNVDGYSFAALVGGDDLDGSLIMALVRTYLDHYVSGINYGTILGDYDAEGSLKAIGLGGYVEEPLTLSGRWGYEVSSIYDNKDDGYLTYAGDDYGLIGSTTPEWWNQESFDILAMGEYYINEPVDSYIEPFIWNTHIRSYNAGEDNGTTLDGGAFWGLTGGIWNNEIMDGGVAALYVAPTGTPGIYTAGVLRGYVNGNYYPFLATAMWQTTGTLTPTLIAEGLEISPEDLGEYIHTDNIDVRELSGSFVDDEGGDVGEIYGKPYPNEDLEQYYAYTYSIGEDPGWGIFDIKLGNGNYYTNGYWDGEDLIIPTDWKAVMGGDYWTGPDDTEQYWLANISGTWADNEIRGDVAGHFLTYEGLGTIEGDLFGVNTRVGAEGTWIASAIGSYTTQPLAWSAQIDAAYHYYYGDWGDYGWWVDHIWYDEDYDHYGIIGATESPFAFAGTPGSPGTPVNVTLIGKAYPYGGIAWWGWLYGSNAGDGSYIPDGFIGGRTDPFTNSVEGAIAALYVNGDDAGLLTGNLTEGTYYPELDMWEAQGDLLAEKRAEGYSDPYIEYWTDWNSIDGEISGGFNYPDEIYSGRSIYETSHYDDEPTSYTGSYTTWLVKDGTPEPWGIYILGLGGYYENRMIDSGPNPWTLDLGGYSWNREDEGYWPAQYWLAHVNGSQWSDERIAGTLTGKYLTEHTLGTITGDVLGGYCVYGTDYFGSAPVDYGDWTAVSVGTWEETPLAWSAQIDAGYHYYYGDWWGDYDWYTDRIWYDWHNDSYHYGIMGAVESPFDHAGTPGSPGTPVNVTLMGKSYPYRDYDYTETAWWGWLYGNDAGDGSYIPDGFIGGRTDPFTNSVEGAIAALYVNGDDAGLLTGNLTEGTYYPELDMWEAQGDLLAEKRAEGYSGVEWDIDGNYIDGEISGVFNYPDEIYSGRSIYETSHYDDEPTSYTGSYTTWLVKDGTPEPWGIYILGLGGYYEGRTPDSDNWTLDLGGYSWNREDEGFWLAHVNGSQWSDQRISGDLTGKYLTSYVLGTITGNTLGDYWIYDSDYDGEYGEWVASSVGTWEETRLAFGGFYDSDFGGGFGYYDSDEGFSPEYGYIGGLLGGTTSLGTTPASVTFIGDYENPYEDKLFAFNVFGGSTDDSTTSFIGTVGGLALNNNFKAGLLGLYVTDTGSGYRAGYVRSSDEFGDFAYLTGGFYHYLDMFDASGYLTTYQSYETDVSPESLITGFDDSGNPVFEYGEFEGIIGGDIKGRSHAGSMNLVGQNWGLWIADSGGTYDSVPSGEWDAVMGSIEKDEDNTSYSLVFIDGLLWGPDGEINGTINGTGLSDTVFREISGDFIGDYDVEGSNWEALSLGVYSDTPLTFSGLVGNKNPNLIYYDKIPGVATGLIGSVDTDWWNPNESFDVVAMGDYDISDIKDAYLWQAPIKSRNADKGNATTLDGKGAFSGWTSAIFGGGNISNMKTIAIYIAPGDTEGQYNAGILKGDMEGNTYAWPSEYTGEPDREVGLWDASGTWTPTVMESNIDIYPSELQGKLDIREAALMGLGNGAIIDRDPLTGDILSTGALSADFILGDMMSIQDCNWGIIQATMSGSASVVSPNTEWSMAVGGMTVDESFVPDGYILATARGGEWVDGLFDGTLGGLHFTPGERDTEGELLTFEVGKLTGDVVGSYQQGSVDTTFQAGAVGEWVDLAQLTVDALGFNDVVLAQMVSVPITETYASILQGGTPLGQNTITSITMDTSFYTTEFAQIWASIINGSYNGTPGAGASWSVPLADTANGYAADLTNGTWTADNTWTADVVNGVGPNGVEFSGQAGGTYADGALTGVGAGEWTEGPR